MGNAAFRSTFVAMKVLEKMIKANPIMYGLDHIPKGPTLFVVNHFTRSETFILPYVLYKYTGKFVYSLTDGALFKGKFGEYLAKVGAVSTEEESRNQMIIGDLMTGRHNWVIYPEGMMVKNKNIFEKGKFRIKYPGRERSVRTGAATMALIAELTRKEFLRAMHEGDDLMLHGLQKEYAIEDPESVSLDPISIVPVNITYYPIRPGQNILKNMVSKFFKTMPERLDEELEIEGSLLLSDTDMTFHFGKPLSLGQYLGRHQFLYQCASWFLSPDKCAQLIVSRHRKKLTDVFMEDIYENVCVNFDHLFCSALEGIHHFSIHKHVFQSALYVAAQKIRDMQEVHVHSTLGDDLIDLFFDPHWEPLQSIFQMAEGEGVIEEKYSDYHIDKVAITMSHMLHSVRLENMVGVIANEVRPLKKVTKAIVDSVNAKPKQIQKELVAAVIEEDRQLFHQEYQAVDNQETRMDADLGRPIWMPHAHAKWGVVLCHGYLSTPQQMRDLAESIHALGMSVYVVRLPGHGTSPEQLNDIEYQNWGRAFDRAYMVVKESCSHVILGGFSLGGIVALWKAAQYGLDINAVFAINPPIKLRDIKSHLVGPVQLYNNLLDRLHLDGAKLDYVDNDSETPDLNYDKNYIKGIVELNKCVHECWDALPRVVRPSLVIQAEHDPVVHSQSAQMIFDKIGGSNKQIKLLPLKKHNILRGAGSDLVFEEVVEFLKGF